MQTKQRFKNKQFMNQHILCLIIVHQGENTEINRKWSFGPWQLQPF